MLSSVMEKIQLIIEDHLHSQGFDAVGFCDIKLDDDQIMHRRKALSETQAGDMSWLWETAELRNYPQQIFPEAKTAIVVASYLGQYDDFYKGKRAKSKTLSKDYAAIAQYAKARKDYHIWMKKKLKAACRFIQNEYNAQSRPYVDTAPVAEKQLAERAGIGWIGKHSNLVSLKFGSKLMLGVIFTELDLPKHQRHQDFCGACTRCVDACPTQALHQPYCLDIPRCISYLTIEHKGDIDEKFHSSLGNHIFGCDECISACPHNKAGASEAIHYNHMRENLNDLTLQQLEQLSQEEFDQLFAGTPIKRTGYKRMQRNIHIAKGNCS